MKELILQEAEAIFQESQQHRRWLHAHPEVAFDLTQTLAYVQSALEEIGLEVTPCGKSGLTALIGNQPGGKVLLLRADMDALPIPEESGLSYAATNGNMHACGHDIHTAMLLGAAKILKKHEDKLNGQIKLMFQPAEEIFSGASDMIEHGILENPVPDAGMMIHVAAGVPIPAGSVLIAAPGISAPAADYFTITVKGKSCHGSMPQQGVDALNAAAHILIAIQEIQARELGIADHAVMTIGTMQAGHAPNAIADEAVMRGTIRSFDEEIRAQIKRRITEISQGIAAAFRATATVTYDSGAPTLINDKAMCDFATMKLRELLGNAAIPVAMISDGKPSAGGSEDFAYVSQKIPTVMLSLAAGEPKNGYTYPLHHPKTVFDEQAMVNGIAAFVYTAIEYLK